MDGNKPHVALLASPGMGHLIPVLELGQRFVSRHGFKVTIFVVSTDASAAEAQLNQHAAYRDLLHIVLLPPVDVSRLVFASSAILTQLALIMRNSLPSFRSAISAMKVRPTALVVDLFGTEAFAIADEFCMLKYLFCTSNVWFLALTLYTPFLEKKDEDGHSRLREPLPIPGCASISFDDTIDVFEIPDDRLLHDEYCRIGLEMAKADGILANTWEDLEPKTFTALRDSKAIAEHINHVPIYSIGPLVRPAQLTGPTDKVLDWLNPQSPESVLYVSFGSGGTLTADQLTELAWGLEQSRHKFIWVVRPPIEDNACGSFFKIGSRADGTPEYLPDGFVTRTQEFGLVVPAWASQREILSHPSVGGFLSHCGWNSTLESITNGVPMIAWPLYAEQKMNAAMLSDQLGIAVRSSKTLALPNGVVGRNEIEKMVRRVMDKGRSEGKAMRVNAQQLKSSAAAALKDGGSSYLSLSRVAKECEYAVRPGLNDRARGA